MHIPAPGHIRHTCCASAVFLHTAEEGAREPPTATYLSPVHQDKGYGSIEGRNACIKVYIHSVESLLIL